MVQLVTCLFALLLSKLSFVQPKARNVLELENGDDNVRLMLCGSRGVGAVSVGSGNLTTLELLDLEEDEEAEEEEEQEDMDENDE